MVDYDKVQYGLFSEQGDILRDVDECALSGRKIEIGDGMVRISGTPFFYRVAAVEYGGLTDAKRKALADHVPQKKVAAAEPPAAPAPAKKNEVPAT